MVGQNDDELLSEYLPVATAEVPLEVGSGAKYSPPSSLLDDDSKGTIRPVLVSDTAGTISRSAMLLNAEDEDDDSLSESPSRVEEVSMKLTRLSTISECSES